jgi:hypothetical protein
MNLGVQRQLLHTLPATVTRWRLSLHRKTRRQKAHGRKNEKSSQVAPHRFRGGDKTNRDKHKIYNYLSVLEIFKKTGKPEPCACPPFFDRAATAASGQSHSQ